MAQITIIDEADDAVIANWLAARLGDALARSEGPVAVTVPGGSTPFPIMERLVRQDIDWSRIVVWPNDDRVVPVDHPASNAGRMRAIFEPAGAEVVTLSEMEQVPRFALAWLGMGEDGHIASLFPNVDPRPDDARRIVRLTPDPLPPEAPFERVSLSMPALLDSEAIVFVIRGEKKRTVFDGAVGGAHDLPIARFLSAASQPVTCFA